MGVWEMYLYNNSTGYTKNPREKRPHLFWNRNIDSRVDGLVDMRDTELYQFKLPTQQVKIRLWRCECSLQKKHCHCKDDHARFGTRFDFHFSSLVFEGNRVPNNLVKDRFTDSLRIHPSIFLFGVCHEQIFWMLYFSSPADCFVGRSFGDGISSSPFTRDFSFRGAGENTREGYGKLPFFLDWKDGVKRGMMNFFGVTGDSFRTTDGSTSFFYFSLFHHQFCTIWGSKI